MTAPAAAHRLIPILTGLDFLNICTAFGFCHLMMNKIRLSDRLQLYNWETLPTFPFPVQGERQATPRMVKWTPAAGRIIGLTKHKLCQCLVEGGVS